MWLWLDRVNDVRELDSVLDEENWYVIPDKVPITFFGVELHGEAPNIANGILQFIRIRIINLSEYMRLVLTALPREPWTVLKRMKMGVVRDGSVNTGAIVHLAARLSNARKWP